MKASDLMVRNLLTHSPNDSLKAIETTMGTHQVRHIPVVNDDGTVFGLITQKEFLAEAFRITDKFGAHNLRTYLEKTPASQCARTNVKTISPDLPLSEAGRELREGRHGCLLVVDEMQRLIGILSSQDFMRLALSLLAEKEAQTT